MNKKNCVGYILSTLAVLLATLFIVIAPDITGTVFSAEMKTETIYELSAYQGAKPLSMEEVAVAYAKGDFIYSYSHVQVNPYDIRASAVKVAEEVFAGDYFLQRRIVSRIEKSEIYDAGTTSALVTAQDRASFMEITRIDFSLGISMSFESTTGLLLHITYIDEDVSYAEALKISKQARKCGEAYYISTISDTEIDYKVISDVYEPGELYFCMYINPLWGYEGEVYN